MNYFLLFCFIYSITMAPKRRTRQSSFTHLSNLIGSGRDLLPSQLPTLWDILRYELLLREQSDKDLRNYTGAGIANDIYPKGLENCERENSLFVTFVLNSRTTILNKIESSWEQAKNISLIRGTVGVKEAFTSKLDRLFDILNYKCNILFLLWIRLSWLLQLQQVKLNQKPVVDVVLPVIQPSAWYAFSEMIIQTLLTSNVRD